MADKQLFSYTLEQGSTITCYPEDKFLVDTPECNTFLSIEDAFTQNIPIITNHGPSRIIGKDSTALIRSRISNDYGIKVTHPPRKVELIITGCVECQFRKAERTLGAGYAMDFHCTKAGRKIVGYVEWSHEDYGPSEFPSWCPLVEIT